MHGITKIMELFHSHPAILKSTTFISLNWMEAINTLIDFCGNGDLHLSVHDKNIQNCLQWIF